VKTNRPVDQPNRQPMRTCVGCRSTLPIHRLARCTLDADGAVDIDERERNWRSEGWTGFQPGALTPLVQQIYPTVRKAVCLADASNNNQLCVTQTLSSVETVTGALTISKLIQTVPTIVTGDASSLNGVNLCTPCVKQIYNVAKTDFPAIFGQGDIATNVRADCGASFVDGASDPNIIQTATNTTSSGSNNINTDGSVQLTGQQALLSTFLLGFLALAA